MRRQILSFAATLLSLMPLNVSAQDTEYTADGQSPLSCTSIMVGRLASTDGSVMTSHTCDSWYRTWMQMVPARDHKQGAVTGIYEGRMHTQSAQDSTKMYRRGSIAQVAHTYRYLDTAYPCLNEKQLAMGETTISGRKELQNKDGMFMIEELQRIALERCSTAREAITLMGELVKRYGYGDSGRVLARRSPLRAALRRGSHPEPRPRCHPHLRARGVLDFQKPQL